MNESGYWLSPDNPTATVDQRDLENLALGLLDTPEVRKSRAIAEMLWRNVTAWPAHEQIARFDNMIDEYVFYHALRAANSDPWHPGVLRLMAPPGDWFDRPVPGSRWGGDSPDFIYRMIPISAQGHYRIHGELSATPPSSSSYSLMTGSAAPATLAVLDSFDLEVDHDGHFVITVDSTPAGGRRNHLQSRPGVDHLLVRDALGDWMTETPNRLRALLHQGPHQQPLTTTERAQRAAKDILDAVYFTYYCTRSGSGQPPNTLREPASSGAFGGMPTQWGSKGNLCLEPDQALIITANAAGAQFRNVTLSDVFFMSNDYGHRSSSLNMTQMVADADGRYTYVVAHRDPGVYNWLDTGGLRRTIFGHRWQMIPADYAGETPALTARVVRFDELAAALPGGVQMIDVAERQQQRQRRTDGYNRRWIDR